MKLNVEKQFRDKISGKLLKVGDVIEVDDARGAELLGHPMELVTVVAEEAEKPKAKATKKTASKAKTKKAE